MANQFTRLNEILVINQIGHYPQKVHDEGDSLNLNANIHSFFWDYNGPHKTPDYEPVCVDGKYNVTITRFHNKGLIIWMDYIKKDNKPIVRFFTPFHTPMVCTEFSYHLLKEPTTTEDRLAYYYFFYCGFLDKRMTQVVDRNRNYKTKDYHEFFSDVKVPVEKLFKWDLIDYIVIVGPTGDLDKLKIPKILRDQINKILRPID